MNNQELDQAKSMIIDVIRSNYSHVDNVELFIERVKDADSEESLTEVVELLEKACTAVKTHPKLLPWQELYIRVQESYLSDIYPHLKEVNVDSPHAREILQELVSISHDGKYHMLNIETLQYSQTAIGHKAYLDILLKADRRYDKTNYNPAVNIYRTRDEDLEDEDGEKPLKKLSPQDLSAFHNKGVSQVVYDLSSKGLTPFIDEEDHQVKIRKGGVVLRDVEPEFNENIDQYFKLLCNEDETHYNNLMGWISNSMDFSKPLSYMVLIADKGIGKTCIIDALTELIKDADSCISVDDILEYDGFRPQLLTNPFFRYDDGGLDISNTSKKELASEKLKFLMTEKGRMINTKHKPQIPQKGHIRGYFAMNRDRNRIVEQLFPLGGDSALGDRFYQIETTKEYCVKVREHLKDHALHTVDGQEVNKWLVDSFDGPFHKHLMYLIKSQDYRVQSNGRFGNMIDFKPSGLTALNDGEINVYDGLMSYRKSHLGTIETLNKIVTVSELQEHFSLVGIRNVDSRIIGRVLTKLGFKQARVQTARGYRMSEEVFEALEAN